MNIFLMRRRAGRAFLVLWLAALSLAFAGERPTGEPTKPVESQVKAASGKATAEEIAAYEQAVAQLPPDQQAWQRMLGKYLGSFYYPRHVRDFIKGQSNEWDFVTDDPALPRVLIIGDSISCGYTLPVRELLKGKANVHRAPANCGDTSAGLRNFGDWLNGGPWDVIYFNFGIHDRNKIPEEYAERLTKVVDQLKETGATLVWARTTPFDARDGDGATMCARLNEAADAVMKQEGVATSDLYAVVDGRREEFHSTDRMHFRPNGLQALAERAAQDMQTALAGRNP